MGLVSLIWGILSLLWMLLALVPLLGWGNWFMIPFAAVGAILGLQSRRDRRVGLAWLDRELASKPAVEAGA